MIYLVINVIYLVIWVFILVNINIYGKIDIVRLAL